MNIDERARKNESTVLHALAGVGQSHVAACLKMSESTVSRMKDADIGRYSAFLAAIGLKVVPQSYKCAKPDVIAAALTLVKASMHNLNEDASIFYDES